MIDHPRSRCTDPPLKSEMVDMCGDDCMSTVVIINDMSSEMHGRSKLIDELKRHHKVLLFNNRGHFNIIRDKYGKMSREGDDGTAQKITEYMPDPNICKERYGIDAYSTEYLVNDVLRVMDEHGVKKADIIGHSLGAFIAQSLAASHPERVSRLAIAKGFTRYNDYIHSARALFNGPAFKGGYWLWCNARKQVTNGENEYGCTVPLEIANEYAKNILYMDLTKQQLNIIAPTVVVHCKDDDMLGEPITAIPNARIKHVNGCGHIFFSENEAMYSEISKFLNEKK